MIVALCCLNNSASIPWPTALTGSGSELSILLTSLMGLLCVKLTRGEGRRDSRALAGGGSSGGGGGPDPCCVCLLPLCRNCDTVGRLSGSLSEGCWILDGGILGEPCDPRRELLADDSGGTPCAGGLWDGDEGDGLPGSLEAVRVPGCEAKAGGFVVPLRDSVLPFLLWELGGSWAIGSSTGWGSTFSLRMSPFSNDTMTEGWKTTKISKCIALY